jgi:hypothetical protein
MPGVGPILLFDKSILQSLSVDEAVWLDTSYFPCITPVFFTETLADLEKEVQKGRSPEEVVGNLAEKPWWNGTAIWNRYTALIGPGYCDTTESMVSSVTPSTVACATKILSKGSL